MAKKMTRKEPYEVGYGKPPVATQFKKGRSGNPAGRRKGQVNLATVVERALSALVEVTEGNRRVKKSKLEVAVIRLTNAAVNGELKAIKELVPLAALLPGADEGPRLFDQEADQNLALKLAARFMRGNPSPERNDHENQAAE